MVCRPFVVCYIRAPCSNRSTDFDAHYAKWKFVHEPLEKEEIWGQTLSQNEQITFNVRKMYEITIYLVIVSINDSPFYHIRPTLVLIF